MEKQQWRNLKDREVIIIGAGGHSKVIEDILILNGRKIAGFLDDNSSGGEILGKIELIEKYKEKYDFILAIGNNEVREKISIKHQLEYTIAIHPKAIIAKNVEIHNGTVVMAGAIINSNTKIGKQCIINTGAIIEHDNKIEDYAHISPGAILAGNVKVSKKTWIGAGVTIIQGINIGKEAIIGAGSVVIKDIPELCVAVGSPAKPIKFIEKNEKTEVKNE